MKLRGVGPIRRLALGIGMIAVLTAGITVGLAGPAHAVNRNTPLISCTATGSVLQGTTTFQLHGYATYRNNWPTAGIRDWLSFSYIIQGEITWDNNNVNTRLTENGVVKMTADSPDNRVADVWYTITPSFGPIRTSMYGPNGVPTDHRTNDILQFEGIFDIPSHGDPSCTAETKI